jgi:hypothetical protein
MPGDKSILSFMQGTNNGGAAQVDILSTVEVDHLTWAVTWAVFHDGAPGPAISTLVELDGARDLEACAVGPRVSWPPDWADTDVCQAAVDAQLQQDADVRMARVS